VHRRADLEHLAAEPRHEPRSACPLRDLLQIFECSVLVLGLAVVEGDGQAFVLDRPVHAPGKAVDLVAPARRVRLELQPVGAHVADAVHADQPSRVLAGPAADACDQGIAACKARDFSASLFRDGGLLGLVDDRRERPVDVEDDRGQVGSLGETVELGHGSYDTAVLVLIGFVAGFFSALFGVGGGIIVVPLLILLARFQERSAMATSLAAIGLIAVVGAVSYAVRGDVHYGYGLLLGVPAAVGAFGGTALQQRVGGSALSYGFAALLAAIAVWLLI
jgi:hypothetical protein